MKIVILEAESLGEDMKLDRFFEIGEVAIYGKTTLEELPGRIAEADAVIVNKLPMNEETLKDAQYLKYIGLTATGTNNIDFDYTNKRGITVTNVAGYSTEVVAQHTFAMTLYLLEHLRYYDDYVRSGEYANSVRSVIWSANSASFPGRPGDHRPWCDRQKSAQIATAFGCEVIYYSASGKKRSDEYRQVDLDTLLKGSDIVSCHAPLNEKTYHLMDAEAFGKMKETALFINVGRGPIVNEKDLAKALKKGKIAAAGLDVLEEEPMRKDNPLRKLEVGDRLLITPHIAWAAVEARTRLLHEVYKNLKAFQNGEKRNVCTH